MESFKLRSVDRPSVLIEVWHMRQQYTIQSTEVTLSCHWKNSAIAFQVGDVEVRSAVIKNLKKFPNFSDPVYFLEAVMFSTKIGIGCRHMYFCPRCFLLRLHRL